MKKYEVTREFIGGILEGLTHTELTSVRFDIGFTCQNPVGGSPYTIIACKEVD